MFHKLSKLAVAATLAALPLTAPAAFTISSSIIGTPTYAPSSTFTVRFAFTGNTGSDILISAALRVEYDNTDATIANVATDVVGNSIDGWLGDSGLGYVGAEEVVSGSVVTRDITTQGNFSNTVLLPNIVDITFTVQPGVTLPIVINASLDPGSSAGLNSIIIDPAVGAGIPAPTFDLSATQNLNVGEWMLLED